MIGNLGPVGGSGMDMIKMYHDQYVCMNISKNNLKFLQNKQFLMTIEIVLETTSSTLYYTFERC